MYVTYLQWHILAENDWMGNGAVNYSRYIKEYYYPRLMTIPIQNFLIHYYCGRDIGSIIMSYLQITASDDILTLEEFEKQTSNSS